MLSLFLAGVLCQLKAEILEAHRKELIELVKVLPREGEFFTEEAVKKAAPYLPVLFALTEKDIENYDIYPFVALSRGLGDQKEHRQFALRNFQRIQHGTLKLCWAVMLFDAQPSDEIVQFLKAALKDERQAKVLSEMAGPKFDDLKRRVSSS